MSSGCQIESDFCDLACVKLIIKNKSETRKVLKSRPLDFSLLGGGGEFSEWGAFYEVPTFSVEAQRSLLSCCYGDLGLVYR